MKQYSLITDWRFQSPVDRIWDALMKPLEWPQWWRYVLGVVELDRGDANGIGALRRYTWSS